MPRKVFRIRKFEGGLNEHSDPKDLEEGQFANAQDVSFGKLGQARSIGAGTEDTTVERLECATAINPGLGLHSFASAYTYVPPSNIAQPWSAILSHARDAVKAYGNIQCIGGWLDCSMQSRATPLITVNWTSTTAGHSAVEISDSWNFFVPSHVIDDETTGSIDCQSINTLIQTNIDSETSTPNFDGVLEGDTHWCKVVYDTASGPTHDYDSDGAAENTAGTISFTSGTAGAEVTTGTNFTEEQKTLISGQIHLEEQTNNFDDTFVLIEVVPRYNGDNCGFILLKWQPVDGGLDAVAHRMKVYIGNDASDLTWINGTTTTYSFTVHDTASGATDTTSLTTSGTSNDTAGEVATALDAAYSTFNNISSSTADNYVTLTQADEGTANSFTVTTKVEHNREWDTLGEHYLAYVTSTRLLYVHAFDTVNDGTNNAWHGSYPITWTDGGLGTGWVTDTPKPHMYAADGSLRIVDKDFSANLIPAWYGHCGQGSVWAANSAFGGWKVYPQSIKIPTAKVRTDGGTAVGTPSSDMINFYLVKGSDDTGYWNGKYKFHISAVFDKFQESLPDKTLTFSGNETYNVGSNPNCSMTIDIAVTPDATEPFDNCRITGFSVYYTKEEENHGIYHWLGTIDQSDGWTGADGQTAALSQSGSSAHIATVTIPSDVTTFNYEQRGFASTMNDTIHAYNGTDGLQYKTSCIVKGRLIVGNLRYNGKSHTSEMCITPWRMFDTFPIPYGIETVTNDDADAIVHLEAIGDRVLQFKEQNLYIVNIVEAGSVTVESHHRFKGVVSPSHVCQTDRGVFWANETGAYLFDGNELAVVDLFYATGKTTGRRIGASTWSAWFSKDSAVGYDAIRKQVIIKKSNKAETAAGDVYIYDFNVDAWSFGKARFSKNAIISNIVTSPDGNMLCLRQGSAGDTFDNGGEVPV